MIMHMTAKKKLICTDRMVQAYSVCCSMQGRTMCCSTQSISHGLCNIHNRRSCRLGDTHVGSISLPYVAASAAAVGG